MDEHQAESDRKLQPSAVDSRAPLRRHIEERLAEQGVELDTLEQQIADQIQRLTSEIAREHTLAHETDDELAARQRRLGSQEDRLKTLEDDLLRTQQSQRQIAADQEEHEQRLAERERRLAEYEARVQEREQQFLVEQQQLERGQNELRQSQQELTLLRDDLQFLRQRLDRREERQDHDEEQLRNERAQLAEKAAATNVQRRRIAKAMQGQRAAQTAELARRRAEIDRLHSAGHGELTQQLETAATDADSLRKQSSQLRKALNVRAKKLNEYRDQISALTSELEQARNGHDKLSQELAIHSVVSSGQNEEVDALRHERDDLARQLADSARGGAPAAVSEEDARKREDLQRRFEMAIEDVRDLKRRNADLEAQLTQLRPSGAKGQPAGKLDWESQKKRLLASLESDAEAQKPLPEEDRLSLEGTIRITDDMVAQKDREIAELRAQLDGWQRRDDESVIDANSKVLDVDAVIRAEREKLQHLQDEWRDKLRTAEIDISVERARITRDRAAIEEKLQIYQAEQARTEPGQVESDRSTGSRPSRRWLTRLGLKDTD